MLESKTVFAAKGSRNMLKSAYLLEGTIITIPLYNIIHIHQFNLLLSQTMNICFNNETKKKQLQMVLYCFPYNSLFMLLSSKIQSRMTTSFRKHGLITVSVWIQLKPLHVKMKKKKKKSISYCQRIALILKQSQIYLGDLLHWLICSSKLPSTADCFTLLSLFANRS